MYGTARIGSGACVFLPQGAEPRIIARQQRSITARWPAALLPAVPVVQAHVAQSVEHLHGKQKVSGSIPLVGSITRIANGRVFESISAPRPSCSEDRNSVV